jgi:hypothetical protein
MEGRLLDIYTHLYTLPNNVIEGADVYQRKNGGQLVLVKRIMIPDNATDK